MVDTKGKVSISKKNMLSEVLNHVYVSFQLMKHAL
jgi:hypothetical protein